jgi:hypothetical protein
LACAGVKPIPVSTLDELQAQLTDTPAPLAMLVLGLGSDTSLLEDTLLLLKSAQNALPVVCRLERRHLEVAVAALQAAAERAQDRDLFGAAHLLYDRLVGLLEDLETVLGDRPLQVARELTKRHEQQVGPRVSAALEHFRRQPPQGECTLVLGGAAPTAAPAWDGEDLRQQLQALLAEGLSRSEAARALAARSGQSRRELYALLHHPDEGAPDEVGPDEAP